MKAFYAFAKNSPKLALLACLAACTLLAPAASAQRATRRTMIGRQGYNQYMSLTIGTGTAFYWGDLNDNSAALASPREQLSLGFKLRFNQSISLRIDAQYYSLQGSDALHGDESRKKRNLSFFASNFEAAAIGQFDFVRPGPFQDKYSRRGTVNMYAFAGIGLTTNTPKTNYKGETVSLRPLQTEGVAYSAIQPVIPIGIGARFRIGPASDILLEYGYRICFTDYLDDISGTYLPTASFSNPLAAAVADRRGEINPDFINNQDLADKFKVRGNPAKKDAYALLSIKYQHTFTALGFQRFKRGLSDRRFRSRVNRYK